MTDAELREKVLDIISTTDRRGVIADAIVSLVREREAGSVEPRCACHGMTPEDWACSGDTGLSSLAIWEVMTGRRAHALANWGSGRSPLDPDDFGRCYRLLQHFPAWRARLPEVAARFPHWAPLVREWDRMTALYEEELKNPDGMAPKLYALMQALRKEGGDRW